MLKAAHNAKQSDIDVAAGYIEPSELLERLKTGKNYKENQADRAAVNFFTLSKILETVCPRSICAAGAYCNQFIIALIAANSKLLKKLERS